MAGANDGTACWRCVTRDRASRHGDEAKEKREDGRGGLPGRKTQGASPTGVHLSRVGGW